MVDEDFARRYWPKGDALGQQLFHPGVTGRDQPWSGYRKSEVEEGNLFTIVGVVGTVKQAELTEAQGQGAVYLPFLYRDGNVFVVIRTSQRPEAFAETLRKLCARESRPAFDNVRSMERSRGSPSRGVRQRCSLECFACRAASGAMNYCVPATQLRNARAKSEFAWREVRKKQIGTQFYVRPGIIAAEPIGLTRVAGWPSDAECSFRRPPA